MLRWWHFLALRNGSLVGTLAALLIAMTTAGPPPARALVPAPPVEVSALAVSSSEVDLFWSAVPGADIAGYAILRNATPLATLNAGALLYMDVGVQPSTTYTYTVATISLEGSRSAPSGPVVVRTPAVPETPDLMPPSAPAPLTATPHEGAIALDWYDATDDTNISAYQIRRDGLVLATVNSETLAYTDTLVQPSTTYTYTVEALDVVGHHSLPSNPAVATTASFAADGPPATPGGLTATPGAGAIVLNWRAVAGEADLIGYAIHRNGTPLASVTSAALSYTDTDVLEETLYTYTVEAVDAAGNHSAPSVPATAMVPC